MTDEQANLPVEHDGEYGAGKRYSTKDGKQQRLTEMQENFCRHCANGSTYTEAYVASYNVAADTKRRSIHLEASRVARLPKIRARIAEIKRLRGEQNHVTIQRLNPELFHALDLAKENGDPVAMSTVINSIARLNGLFEQGAATQFTVSQDVVLGIPSPNSGDDMQLAHDDADQGE
jgi:hypothetical protein